nr:MAG: capsid protein [Wufeng shrew picorna-like virus 15]
MDTSEQTIHSEQTPSPIQVTEPPLVYQGDEQKVTLKQGIADLFVQGVTTNLPIKNMSTPDGMQKVVVPSVSLPIDSEPDLDYFNLDHLVPNWQYLTSMSTDIKRFYQIDSFLDHPRLSYFLKAFHFFRTDFILKLVIRTPLSYNQKLHVAWSAGSNTDNTIIAGAEWDVATAGEVYFLAPWVSTTPVKETSSVKANGYISITPLGSPVANEDVSLPISVGIYISPINLRTFRQKQVPIAPAVEAHNDFLPFLEIFNHRTFSGVAQGTIPGSNNQVAMTNDNSQLIVVVDNDGHTGTTASGQLFGYFNLGTTGNRTEYAFSFSQVDKVSVGGLFVFTYTLSGSTTPPNITASSNFTNVTYSPTLTTPVFRTVEQESRRCKRCQSYRPFCTCNVRFVTQCLDTDQPERKDSYEPPTCPKCFCPLLECNCEDEKQRVFKRSLSSSQEDSAPASSAETPFQLSKCNQCEQPFPDCSCPSTSPVQLMSGVSVCRKCGFVLDAGQCTCLSVLSCQVQCLQTDETGADSEWSNPRPNRALLVRTGHDEVDSGGAISPIRRVCLTSHEFAELERRYAQELEDLRSSEQRRINALFDKLVADSKVSLVLQRHIDVFNQLIATNDYKNKQHSSTFLASLNHWTGRLAAHTTKLSRARGVYGSELATAKSRYAKSKAKLAGLELGESDECFGHTNIVPSAETQSMQPGSATTIQEPSVQRHFSYVSSTDLSDFSSSRLLQLKLTSLPKPLVLEASRHLMYDGNPTIKVETTTTIAHSFRIIVFACAEQQFAANAQVSPNEAFQLKHVILDSNNPSKEFILPWYRSTRRQLTSGVHCDIWATLLESSASSTTTSPQLHLFVSRGSVQFYHPINLTSATRQSLTTYAQPQLGIAKSVSDAVRTNYDDLHWEIFDQGTITDTTVIGVLKKFSLAVNKWPSHVALEVLQHQFFRNYPIIKITTSSDSRSRARVVLRTSVDTTEPAGTGSVHVHHEIDKNYTIYNPEWKHLEDRLEVADLISPASLVLDLVENAILADSPVQYTLWMNRGPVESMFRTSP